MRWPILTGLHKYMMQKEEGLEEYAKPEKINSWLWILAGHKFSLSEEWIEAQGWCILYLWWPQTLELVGQNGGCQVELDPVIFWLVFPLPLITGSLPTVIVHLWSSHFTWAQLRYFKTYEITIHLTRLLGVQCRWSFKTSSWTDTPEKGKKAGGLTRSISGLEINVWVLVILLPRSRYHSL